MSQATTNQWERLFHNTRVSQATPFFSSLKKPGMAMAISLPLALMCY